MLTHTHSPLCSKDDIWNPPSFFLCIYKKESKSPCIILYYCYQKKNITERAAITICHVTLLCVPPVSVCHYNISSLFFLVHKSVQYDSSFFPFFFYWRTEVSLTCQRLYGQLNLVNCATAVSWKLTLTRSLFFLWKGLKKKKKDVTRRNENKTAMPSLRQQMNCCMCCVVRS